jgi:8-oxo-dGTP diphosphatase
MDYPKIGVGVLIFNHNHLLLGQRNRTHGSQSWGPPGGHLEFGESFEECAIREVKEETGLIISCPQFTAVTNDVFSEENKHYVSIFLNAEYPKDQWIQNLEPKKLVSWEWVDIKGLPQNLFLPLKNLILDKGSHFLFALSEASSFN